MPQSWQSLNKFYESVLEIIWNKVLRVIKTVNKHAIDIISKYLKKMMRSGNAVPSHNGLIPSETLYEKRGWLLWPIARERNLISLRSAAFYTIFVCNMDHAYKFHGHLKTAPHLRQVSRTLKTRKVIKWGFRSQKQFPIFCVYKWASLIIHWHCFQVS